MIVTAVPARAVARATRLDATYFTAPGVLANTRLETLSGSGAETFKIDDVGDVEHVTRFKRVLAAPDEPSVPFLRAFDVFEYMPEPADLVSERRTPDLDTLRVEPGVILVTRSGRNLGPCVLTDDYLSGFIPSDDLLRVRIKDEGQRLFAFAFLCSPSGQDLLRQDRTGSVISHLSAGQVGSQTVPLLDSVYEEVIQAVGRAHELRGRARKTLSDAVATVDAVFPAPDRERLANGWAVKTTGLVGRLDAAFHQSWLRTFKDSVEGQGGVRLGDVADITKPGGRYKTNYVSPDHGRPLLSGSPAPAVSPDRTEVPCRISATRRGAVRAPQGHDRLPSRWARRRESRPASADHGGAGRLAG